MQNLHKFEIVKIGCFYVVFHDYTTQNREKIPAVTEDSSVTRKELDKIVYIKSGNVNDPDKDVYIKNQLVRISYKFPTPFTAPT